MISDETELERLRRHERIAWDHVAAFKALMVDAQEKRESLEDELEASRNIRKRQSAIIARLEEQLGIDREL